MVTHGTCEDGIPKYLNVTSVTPSALPPHGPNNHWLRTWVFPKRFNTCFKLDASNWMKNLGLGDLHFSELLVMVVVICIIVANECLSII